jgi:glycosyltransferase involved in cell wall biosynthesis
MKYPNSIHQNIFFYAHHTFEQWDYSNPTLYGIGGSETSQIEMASRLAQRHHNVVSYAPVGWADEFRMHRNVKWMSYDKADWSQKGLWIIYRCPEALDAFNESHPGQEVWYVAQDVFYKTLDEDRASKIDKYICLCNDHALYTAHAHPYLSEKIVISSNGLSVDVINAIETKAEPRNPYRILYSSSPDRGLEQLIPIFRRAKEFIPELELHIYYGFDNIDKVIERMPWVGKMKETIMAGINSTDGIFWHGRVGQIELLTEWFKSGIWVYPVNFTETSCISCMEAQACGVIPIASSVWALRENIMHGILIEGQAKDKLVMCRFIGEIVRVCRSVELRNKLTKNMATEAKFRFNWERYVDQWESWIYQPECKFFFAQFAFQQKYAYGKILNVGSDIDSSGFATLRNADNLDIVLHDNAKVAILGSILDPTIVDAIKDKYDSVVLGDVIEHMTHEDGVTTLKHAKTALRPSTLKRHLIITCPSDPRSIEEQKMHSNTPGISADTTYAGGVSIYHRYIERDELVNMIHEAGLKIELIQDIDYTHFHGHGVICTV